VHLLGLPHHVDGARRWYGAVALSALLAALAFPPTALASSSLPGRYTTKITGILGFSGTWSVTFGKLAKTPVHTKQGSYIFVLHRHVRARGKYSVAGHRVTFSNDVTAGGCGATPETYAWTVKGRTLALSVISKPPCLSRSLVLSNTLTKAS
jgi:hypothetical protein